MENKNRFFKQYLADLNFKRMQIVLFCAIFLYPSFWILDLFVVPQFAALFLKIRIIGTLIFLISFCIFILPWTHKFAKKILNWIIYTNFLAGYIGIALMIRYYRGYASPYYAGLSLVVLFFSISIIAPPIYYTVLNLLVLSMYLVPALLFDTISDIPVFISNMFFLVSTLFIASLYCSYNYFQQKKVFNLTYTTERQNEELKKLDQFKSRFFDNITHELRTPLTLIATPLEMLLAKKEALPQDVSKQIDIMHANSLRLLKLINSVLDLHKIEAGKMTLNCEKGDLAKFIKYLKHSFDSAAEHKRLAIEFQQEENLPEFAFDKDKIENIFVNLVFNALKFTPAGGKIKVNIGSRDNYAYFCVEDTGIGIEKEKIALIFDRFTQADDSTKKTHSGTGIGLALVKELVNLHQGKITVESKEGQGAKFTVYIPMNLKEIKPGVTDSKGAKEDMTKTLAKKAVYSPDRELAKPSKSPAFSIAGHSKLTILAVDDNTEMLSVLRDVLKTDYNAFCSNNSVEALKWATANTPDIIISDLMMPQLDGLELCKLLKQNPKTKRIPFILLTAKAELSERVKGLYAGVDDYLFKPFHPAELKARISAMLRLKQLSDEIAQKNERLEELNSTLQELAIKDPLTGIYNRRYLYEFLQKSIKSYNAIGVMIIDVDHFKKYNDENGHLEGDNALKKIVDLIIVEIGNKGKVFRYGGEEFVVILPDKDKMQTAAAAQRVRKRIEQTPFEGEKKMPGNRLTISIGVSAYPENGSNLNSLLNSADNALYKAKETRNTVYTISCKL